MYLPRFKSSSTQIGVPFSLCLQLQCYIVPPRLAEFVLKKVLKEMFKTIRNTMGASEVLAYLVQV